MLAVGCFAMFVIEGIVPFLYFAPRRTRMLAFWLTILLQVEIALTGNYGFFNVLTIVLALSLLDDAAIARIFHRSIPTQILPRPILRPIFVWPLAVVIFIVTSMVGIERVSLRQIDWPRPLAALENAVRPFASTNSYGLFAVMTKDRPEIIFEGSDDQRRWEPYEFKWKAGDVMRRPAFCFPHMPRLDWQMWFAALDPQRNADWLQNFAYRLLANQPQVLALLARNPFPDHPPRYLRAWFYDYRFTTPQQRRTSGAWWTRRAVQQLLPPSSIR
jgi:hypothetical protein